MEPGFKEDDAYCHSERSRGISRCRAAIKFALVQSKNENPQSQIEMSIYRRVLRYYRPFLGQTILGLFLSLLGVGLNLLEAMAV